MTNQGLFGALDQYWNVQPKPRLAKKNTFFDEVQVSNYDALKFGVAFSTIATAIVIFWSLMGLIL